ncbi:MAG TPA: substrate-binding domain-containing protein [Actinoplanes sp.]|jgi:phosphate transport system substrate-binding protein
MQRARLLLILATASTAMLAPVGTSAAQAVPPGDTTVQVLAAAGSDTTQDVMTAVLDAYTADRTTNPDGDLTINIPVRPNPGLTVPADDTCEERTYVPAGQENPPAGYAAPSGSGAGKTALQDTANLTSACIDIARSSSAGGSSDPATFEYYGYAKDAVSWAHFPGAAPDELSLDALRGIYACTITNWNQVGGQDAPIVRYLPPAGSGTRSFFVGTVLGAEPSTSCGDPLIAAENDGSAVPADDRATAILPFSAAGWVAQANGVSADVRATAVIGGIDGQNPVSGPDTTGAFQPDQAVINGGFIGVRTVYNVLDTRLPSYPQALRAVGFDATGPGYLCSGSAANTLTTYGLTPLAPDTNGTACTRS